MALRHRDIVPTVVDENKIHLKAGKAHLSKPVCRPALNELSNKPIIAKKEAAKDLKPTAKVIPQQKKENVPPAKSYSSTQIATAIDHDIESSTDPQMVSEYLGDIFQYLCELETKYPIKENFLEGHSSSPRMRAILVNWLVQVHSNFSLCLETLHMCVSIIDRYLQDNPHVGRQSLQLVGTAALLVACKYEEMYLPDLNDFIYICDNTFTDKEILKMEMSILINLDYSLGKPLSIHFLRRFSKLAQVRLEQHNLSKYLLELTLLDHTMCHIKPSLQAAAACCLSMAILSNASCTSKVWTPQLAHYTNCKYSDFKHVIVKLAQLLYNAESSKHKSIPCKYAESKYNKISINSKVKGPLVKRLAESSWPKV